MKPNKSHSYCNDYNLVNFNGILDGNPVLKKLSWWVWKTGKIPYKKLKQNFECIYNMFIVLQGPNTLKSNGFSILNYLTWNQSNHGPLLRLVRAHHNTFFRFSMVHTNKLFTMNITWATTTYVCVRISTYFRVLRQQQASVIKPMLVGPIIQMAVPGLVTKVKK